MICHVEGEVSGHGSMQPFAKITKKGIPSAKW
jgi:hypothetical protein